jgi:hypothetical protein
MHCLCQRLRNRNSTLASADSFLFLRTKSHFRLVYGGLLFKISQFVTVCQGCLLYLSNIWITLEYLFFQWPSPLKWGWGTWALKRIACLWSRQPLYVVWGQNKPCLSRAKTNGARALIGVGGIREKSSVQSLVSILRTLNLVFWIFPFSCLSLYTASTLID